jgi:hypothetical protein
VVKNYSGARLVKVKDGYRTVFMESIYKYRVKILQLGDDQNVSELMAELDSVGFYDLTTQDGLIAVRDLTLKTRELFWEETNRCVTLDSEKLFEGGLKAVFFDLNKLLRLRNIRIESLTDCVTDESDYTVAIDGKSYVLWKYKSRAETEYEAFCATVRFLNMLLLNAGSVDRVYFQYTGNDSMLLFLTEKMLIVLATHKALDL